MAIPVEAFSGRTAFKSTLTKIKKFASLDYLLHCDCPKHKKNQTLKNQIRRHPERLGIYLAAGAGLLLASWKLFASGTPNSTIPQPPKPPVPPVPAEPVVVPVDPTPIVVPGPGPEPVNPVAPIEVPNVPAPGPQPAPQPEPEPEPIITIRPRPQLTPIELVDIDAPVEHEARVIQILARPTHVASNSQPIRVINLQPIEIDAPIEHQSRIIEIPAPGDDLSLVFPNEKTQKPESPVPTQEESPRIIPPKDKDEADQVDASSANNSVVVIANDNNPVKGTLSEPLQLLIAGGLNSITTASLAHDVEELLLLGAACNHALMTNNEEVINLLSQDHPRAVRALTWYYYALAAEKKQMFEEGTFLIAHPRAQAIIDFLNRNPHTDLISIEILNRNIKLPALESIPQAYERISSHFGKFMELNDKHEQHYGLDIDDLPTGKQTLLFGHVDKDKNMVFIKPESHGTLSVKDIVLHAVSFVESAWVKIIAAISEGPSHDDDPKFRKERVPVEILRSFNIFTQELVNAEVIIPEEANILNKNARASGIAFMYAIAKPELISKISNNNEILIKLGQEFTALIEANFDHINYRFGREVILTPLELEKFVTQDDFERIRRHFNF